MTKYDCNSCYNINWRDVQTKNVVNNVGMSCLRAPWQKARTKTNTRDDTNLLQHHDATDI